MPVRTALPARDIRMATHDLGWFADEVTRLAAAIGAPTGYLPTYGHSEDFARPHIEFDGAQFHFVVVERGQELERVSSPDPQEIVYRVFEAVTFSMASDYEVRHRRPWRDTRRLLFDKQLELMGKLSPEWKMRTQARLDEALKENPFRD